MISASTTYPDPSPSHTAPVLSLPLSEDGELLGFFAAYLERVFSLKPLNATALGDHRFDGQLDDVSDEARTAWSNHVRQSLRELLQRVDFRKLSRDGQVDFEILRDHLVFQLWTDENFKPFETDPRTYGAYLNESVYALVAQSTRPKEINIANAIARMKEMPRILEEAERSLVRPSRPSLETAIRQNLGAIRFYEKELFLHAGETPQRETLEKAADTVAAALRNYQKLLESTLRERSTDDWRLGKATFAVKFEYETAIGVTAEENLEEAESEFARVHGQLHAVARQLWPQYFPGRTMPPDDAAGRRNTIMEVVDAVSQEHGAADEMLEKVMAAAKSTKDFVRKRKFLVLPEPDRCDIIEMPEFRRGNSLAFLENAPPLDPGATSFYAVSPPPEDWTPEQKRGFLEEYNDHMLQILTIHEAYPGHYVQIDYANRHTSLIRSVLASGSYIEGWAVYCEEAMLDAGYGEGDLRLRLMQLKFYLRAVANSILDYKMHCTEMTDAEAMEFLTKDAFQSEGEAKLKVIRAKQSAVQLSTYFAGRMAFHRLRQGIENELNDNFDLGRYHEAVLTIGAVPPKYLPELVRERLKLRK